MYVKIRLFLCFKKLTSADINGIQSFVFSIYSHLAKYFIPLASSGASNL